MSSPPRFIFKLQQTLPVTTLLIDNNGSSGTGLYMEINGAYKSDQPPAVNINENPAYEKLDYDYIYDITNHSHFYIHSILYSLYNNYVLFNNFILKKLVIINSYIYILDL